MTTNRPKPKLPQTQTIERIKAHLATLKLTAMLERFDQEMDKLQAGQIPPSQLLLNLLEIEVLTLIERRIERRIRESKLPERKTLASFDFDFQPDLDRALVMELFSMGFVARRQGVILAGKSGTGKSHLAKSLALEACKCQYRVRYTTAADMLRTLYASLADDSFEDALKAYVYPDLLVIDEVGFDRLEREDARNAALFFKVIDGRYARCSTILTTNIDFEQLGEYLGDPLVTTSIVDRLIHHSTVITINGPSWRHKESKELNRSMREGNNTGPRTDENCTDQSHS